MATLSQLTTDPALETHLFWDQHKTTIIAFVLVLVLGGLGYGGYQLYNAQQANNAMALLTAARKPEQYQQVIDRYPGSGPAASDCLLLAAEQTAGTKYT